MKIDDFRHSACAGAPAPPRWNARSARVFGRGFRAVNSQDRPDSIVSQHQGPQGVWYELIKGDALDILVWLACSVRFWSACDVSPLSEGATRRARTERSRDSKGNENKILATEHITG